MITARTSPPIAPINTAEETTEASPVDRYWDQGHRAPASSTTSRRNDLLMAPWRVMRSPRAARGWLAKVLSLSPGLPVRGTGRGIVGSPGRVPTPIVVDRAGA